MYHVAPGLFIFNLCASTYNIDGIDIQEIKHAENKHVKDT